MSVVAPVAAGWLRPGLTRAGLLALVVAEGLLLSLRVDFMQARDRGVAWGGVLSAARYAFGGGLVFVLVAGLTFARRTRRSGEGWTPDRLDWSWWQGWPLVGHLAAFAAIWMLAPGVLAEPSPFGAGLLTGLVVAAGGLWLGAALPWRWMAERRGDAAVAVAAGAAAAAAAIGMGSASGWFWRPLRAATFAASRAVLGLMPVEVVCDANRAILGTTRFDVHIAEACSGYEGLGLMTVFLAVTFWLFRRELRFPQALVLVPIGLVGIWCLNVARIVALILIGHAGHAEVAVGGFHSQAGWLAFNAAGLGLVALARRWRFVSAAPAAEPSVGVPPTLAYLGPMLAIVLASMIGDALGDGAVTFYPLRVVAALGALWAFRGGYGDATWRPSGRGLWAIGVGVVVLALWMALEPPVRTAERAPVDLGTPWGVFWLACRVVGSVVLVPVAEELAFRGYLMRRLIAADFRSVPVGTFTWPSLVVSSLLFGLLHSRWQAGALAGAIYAVAVYRRGRLGDAMLAHGVTNGLIAAWAIVGGRWSLWS
jgi:exosortase E/protease (VPEID-CTERM system)